MIAIGFRFTAGRFHATPWGRHVNEGVPEWPPSPWRILRALVASWGPGSPGNLEERTVRSLLTKLSSPPSYYLPPAAVAHTRHFMPWEKKGPGDRAMVFDTFVVVDPKDRLVVVWEGVDLTEGEAHALRLLLENLAYLGRSESWCDAEIVRYAVKPNCVPTPEGTEPSHDVEVVRVIAPALPPSLGNLMVETTDLRRRKMDPINPPGARWISYQRPAGSLVPRPKETAIRDRERVKVVRYSLDGPVLPFVLDAVKVGDLARRAAMGSYGRRTGGRVSPALAGKDAAGRFLRGHQHASYLPTDEDGDGWLDHLTIHARAGFDPVEQNALGAMRRLRQWEGRPDINLVLLGLGAPEDFEAPIFNGARVWVSVTPFILVRHPKLRGDTAGGTRAKKIVDGPEDQVRLELKRRGFPEPLSVEPVPRAALRGIRLPWLAYYSRRGRGQTAGGAYGFKLRFRERVTGPISLGYGAHFGLGLFVPVANHDREE